MNIVKLILESDIKLKRNTLMLSKKIKVIGIINRVRKLIEDNSIKPETAIILFFNDNLEPIYKTLGEIQLEKRDPITVKIMTENAFG